MDEAYNSFHEEDRVFIEKLFGAPLAKKEGSRWFVLKRKGRCLLLVSDTAAEETGGFDLYQPQTLIARSMVRLQRWAIRFAGRPLGLTSIYLGNGGAVSATSRHFGGTADSVLLGNPCQLSRRAVVRLKLETGGFLVCKTGFSKEARALILREKTFLERIHEKPNVLGIPALYGPYGSSDYDAFAMEFIQGSSTGRDNWKSFVKVLSSWLSNEPCSPSLFAATSREIGKAPGFDVKKSLRHGDFAPWNVISRADGKPVVIDWEMGAEDGVAGWDLTHWLVQEARLVGKLDDEQVCDVALSGLKDLEFSDFLERAGWGGKDGKEWLLLSYLCEYADDPAFLTRSLLETFLTKLTLANR